MQTRTKYLCLFVSIILVFFLQSCSSRKAAIKENYFDNNGSTFYSLQKKYAALLGVQMANVTNKELYGFIDKWLNTKYEYGSQSTKGIDCSGFTQVLFAAVYNEKIPRTSQEQYKAISTFHRKKYLKEGDLIFFATGEGKRISHVGVYLQNNKFVNATTSKGVVVSDLSQKYWDDRFIDGGTTK